MIYYLQLDGTCKCGLECPLKPDEVFSFNPRVPSKFGFSAQANADPNRESQCAVCRKFETLFPPALKLKVEGRSRKPGKKVVNYVHSSRRTTYKVAAT